MPNWLRVTLGLALAATLIAIAAVTAYSERRSPFIQEHGTTYYDRGGPVAATLPCKPETTIKSAIEQVHAKFDYYTGAGLEAFEAHAGALEGLPPLHVDKLYVITEDDQLRNGEMVLFIGLRVDCVSIVFGFPSRLYSEIVSKSDS